MSTQQRRPDASMTLLREITEQALDPAYARAAAGPHRPRARVMLMLVLLLAGALFAVAAVQTTKTRPAIAAEREELIRHIEAARARQNELRARVQETDSEVTRLQNEAIGHDRDLEDLRLELDRLEPLASGVAVQGPGVVLTVDDAPGDQNQRVVDTDLQQLVNGLWSSGAEAIAINGHRLSSLTAIRGAGESITVDYRSLSRPYVVEAIGNPKTLLADFADSSGGRWWAYVTQNFGLRFDSRTADVLELAADPGQDLRYAGRSTTR
ncbi:DUF881 domain-containing protein [Enemella sp. A6]|uniref:DUF881 domain-containing protein n=1 Tax=Enemella sp. A6 TaxID=3440152 RepID=UPI003EBA74A1